MISSITHEIVHNPEDGDGGTIKICVCITKIYQTSYGTFSDDVMIEPSNMSLREPIDLGFTELLTESGDATREDACKAMLDVVRLAGEVISSDGYTLRCALRVWMTLTTVIFDMVEEAARPPQLYDINNPFYLNGTMEDEAIFDSEHQIQEVLRASFNETNTAAGLRPASKLVVGSLNRKICKKTSEAVGESPTTCIICLEEFKEGRSIVTLPCGHMFDDECVVQWFLGSHVCPLCRFELPCER